MKKQTGITLIELIIAMSILGVMAAIAVPNFGGLMANTQLKSSYNAFVGVIASARVEAVNRRSTITICPSSNGTSCLGGNAPDWSEGYIAYADLDRDSVVDAGEVLHYETVPNGVSINSSYALGITFAARGRLASEGTIVFCKDDNEGSAKALNLWITGLGRLATDTDTPADGIVDDLDHDNVSCS